MRGGRSRLLGAGNITGKLNQNSNSLMNFFFILIRKFFGVTYPEISLKSLS
jgi:hypothetical protein